MTRILAAVLGLALVLTVPASALAQSQTQTFNAPLLAYQSDDQRLSLSVGAWFGSGKWQFTGPVDARANNTLIMLDARIRLRGPWSLGLDYAGGAWNDITFNGSPAPATLSGSVSMFNADVRYRMGSNGVPIDLFAGWQIYRARTADSGLNTSDEARAGGLRVGLEAWVPIRGPWSARGMFAYAPSLGVTEDFVSMGTTTTTVYNGSLSDFQLAIRYDTGRHLAAEVGWRGMRIDFRRPTDTLEHTLDGVFLHVIWRQ
jgi:hypothetical protein